LALPWIAVNTNPHREPIVLEHLQRQALAAYCPTIRKQLTGDMVTPAYGSL
jgi:hypothetical protein